MTLFIPNEEYVKDHALSNAAYRLRDMISVAFCAFENDSSAVDMENRGIASTLEAAEKLAGEIVDMAEGLEYRAKQAPPAHEEA